MRFFALALVLPIALHTLSATKLVPESREDVSVPYAPLVKRVAPALVNVYAARAVAPARSPFGGDPLTGSQAARAALRPRDVMLAVHDPVVTTSHELAPAIASERYFWKFDLVRNGRRLRSFVR